MKQFDFKLKGLLKLREFTEEKKKIELGELVKEIQRLKDENESISLTIDIAYQTQEKELRQKTDGRAISFYPYYIAGRKAHIQYNETRIHVLYKQYEVKVEEMKKAMGDVKIIAGLKDKQYTKYKKKADRRQQEDLEELFLMRKSRGIL